LALILAVAVSVASDRKDAHATPALSGVAVRTPLSSKPAASGTAAAVPINADTVVLLVIDGIRWQEIFWGVDPRLAVRHGMQPARVVGAAELTPNLYRLRTQYGGAIGAPDIGDPIVASGPVYRSLPGYMELLSGKAAAYCKSNRCGSVRHLTLMDEVAQEAAPEAAALFASWPHLLHAAAMQPEKVVISAGRKGGTRLQAVYDSAPRQELREAANRAGAAPSKGDFRGDAFTAKLALDYLVDKLPQFLFVSLGEADAFGHANNYPAHLNALRRSDDFAGQLASVTRRLNLAGHRTTLLVTTDHGRDEHAREHGPAIAQSARVWLIASGFGVHRRGLLPSPEPRTLSDIAPAVRALLGLASAGAASPALPELFSW
jgi:hypothetical protein